MQNMRRNGATTSPRRPGRHVAVLLTHVLLAVALLVTAGADWPQFRGPGAQGLSTEKGLPTDLSSQGRVAWKVDLPGTGPASPIVVRGRVIVTGASGPRQERLETVAIDTANGHQLWRRTAWATGHTLHNAFGGVAGSTPASDGKRIFALFSSNDVYCFDLDGNLLWMRGLALEIPATRNDTGMASSPLVVGDTLVLHLENPGESFATGLNVIDGTTRWKIPLENGGCWTTPVWLPATGSGSTGEGTVVLQSRQRLTGHDPMSGKKLWTLEQPCSTISSSTPWRDCLLAPIGGLMAIRPVAGAASPDILWKEQRLSPNSMSPVVDGDRLYVIKSPGVLVAGDAATGKTLWQLRLRGPFWATPAIAAGHLYAINQDGLVQLVKLGDDGGEVVGTLSLDEPALASPAVADGAVYFRTRTRLWKIGGAASSQAVY